ncbi:MAG: transglutaminase domain-containing protein [candidate division Zixibacteria bacterium]|nr:transglutaminase domain-containing protein [candidate division Zixibacteria bacterium]
MKYITAIIIIANSVLFGQSANQFDEYLGKDWYGIYMQDNKIGCYSMELSKKTKDRWIAKMEMNMTFMMNQTKAEMSSSETRIYQGRNAELAYSKFVNISDAGSITVEGKKEGDNYNVVIDIAGQKTVTNFDCPVETLADVLKIEMLAVEGKLHVGDRFAIKTFESEPPMTGITNHLTNIENRQELIFGGVATDIFVVRDSLPAIGVTAQLYVDYNGNILKQGFAPLGMVMKSEPEELARQLDCDYDLLTNNIIKTENGPENPAEIYSAVYIISGYDIAQLPASDRLIIDAFSIDSAQITVNRKVSHQFELDIPIDNDSLNSYLQAEQLIQSDNPEIIKLAKAIVGDETNAFEAAKLINNWVHENIRKEFSPDISNALQTLKAGRGDCGEHSALATALNRALGIPSRIIAGVAYWPGGKGFAFHAWIEVYVGEWIQMDPTWGETFADATHIMLAKGGLIDQIGPVYNGLMGLKIKIVSCKQPILSR